MEHLTENDIWAIIDKERTLSPAQQEHLHTCTVCQSAMSRALDVHTSIRNAFISEIPPITSAKEMELMHSVLQRVQEQPTLTKGVFTAPRWLTWPRLISLSGAAAALFVAVWFGVQALQSPVAQNKSAASSTASIASTGASPHTFGANAQNNGVSASQASAATSSSVNGLATTDSTGQTVQGTTVMTIQDAQGRPIAGAHVAFVVKEKVIASAVTTSNGSTPSRKLQVPVDPMLSSTFGPGNPPSGVVTVVVWKSGYQPLVWYGTQVFANSMPYNLTLNLASSTAANGAVAVEGDGLSLDYPVALMGGIGNWAVEQYSKADVQQLQSQLPTPNSACSVQAFNQDGKPVSNAVVAIVANGTLTGIGTTNTEGRVTVGATGAPDWRNPSGANVAAVYVVKDGYAAYVDLYQALSLHQSTSLSVRLDSLAWRTAHSMNNSDAPTGPSKPSTTVTEAQAAQVLSIAQSQVSP